ncbi:hypothetical protein K1T71_014060 [Dendrolimus kikuchii]|uniref:Uncharacterized protein n=1 Tax=Dendrolimus kikuchii TaxID=765133 RepID=A0ACC1CEX8_9NEOP|nr:hypothetical protein K1T71_014060 [Dendrolimus kikuchii]
MSRQAYPHRQKLGDMEGGDGMVAVVRGIRDAGLAVTLLDGTRQYTLLPNPVAQQKPQTQVHITHVDGPSQKCTASNTACSERIVVAHCDSAAQATDGHYASVYKMAHCNVTPTAPPVQLTEFPPQRAELCRGHGNFEVGGCGSGESYSPIRSSGTYRGGMTWTDRGSVCAPKPSHEPDAFANSLRRYPTVSPDRSEVVERLISYTQARNSSKIYQTRTQTSPTRLPEAHSNLMDRSPRASSRCQRSYEHEVNVRTRSKIDESPTRDGKPRKDCEGPDYRRPVFTKSYDVRYLKEVSRRFKDTLRLSSYPYNHPVCPTMKERYDHLPPVMKYLPQQTSTNSVNMETQAAVEMVTREASTIPRKEPSKRTVAVPLSPTASTALQDTEVKAAKAHDFSKEAFTQTPPNQEKDNEKKYHNVKYSCESIKEDNYKAVQTPVSLITLQRDERECVKVRSKSSEDIRDKRDYKEEEILELWEMYSSTLRVEKWREKLQRLAEKLKKPGAEEKLRKKIEKYLGRASSQSDLDEVRKEFKKNLPNDLIRKIKKYYSPEQTKLQSPIVVFRLEVEKDNLKFVLNKWFENINMKKKDFIERGIDKQDILNYLIRKLEPLIKKRFEYSNEYKNSFKNNILKVVEELPLGINGINKKHYLNSITESLVNELLEINCPLSRLNLNKEVGVDCHLGAIDSNFHPTENEIRNFVFEELNCFLDDTNIFLSRNKIDKLEKELTDTFIDFLNCLKTNLKEINRDVCKIFETICNLAEKQAKYFADIIIRDLLKTFRSNNCDRCVTEITKRFSAGTGPFYVYHAKSKQGKFNQSLEMNKLKPRDQDGYSYTKEVTDEIMDWYHNLPYGLHTSQDVSMNKQIIKDLAESIYDGIKSGQISNDVIDREVDSWIKKIDVKSNSANVQRLKNKINNIPLRESINKPGTSQLRTKLNEYEEIIDKWFDTVPLNTNQKIGFEHKRQELIKELAILIDKVKARNATLSSKVLEAKLLEDITDWMVKMPLYRRIDKKNERAKYANKLIPEVLNVKSKNDYSKSKITYPITRDKSSNKAIIEIEPSRKRAEDKQITSKVAGEIQTSNKKIGEKESTDTYLQNLRTQIDEWLSKLNLPHVDNKFKEVAVNELANDILDRHKYLKLNTTRRNAVDELEHLKYQIFKWINKVVGEENSETINHADDLMKRIKSIGQCSNNQIEEDKQTINIRHLSQPDNSQDKIPCIRPKTHDSLRQIISGTESTKDGDNQNLELSELLEGLTNAQLYDHYSDIVRKLCFSLPLDVSTPEKEASSLLARKLLYRNIWLQFNKLRQDPDVDNDYALFDFLMEELLDYHLDIMISPEKKDTVIPWKSKMLTTLISCLKNLHYNTDTPLTKQLLKGNKHRLAIKERYERQELETKDLFINSTIDSFLRDLNYKEDDPIIASIYRQRLTKTLEKFVAGTVHLGPFSKLKINDLLLICIPLLRNVPFPINDITNEEVEEAMIGQVVDAWYNDLQVPSQVPREIQLYQARKRAVLTNKLHQLQRIDIDNELEREMQHEISNYLDNNIIGLIPDERGNINYMTEDLVNRIKNRRKDNISYESFELRVPLHSSFIQQLPPIIEVAAEVHSCPRQPAQNLNFISEHVAPNPQFHILNHTLAEQHTVRNVPRPVPTSIPETIGNIIQNNSVCTSCTSSAVGKTEYINNSKFTNLLNRSAETDNRYVQQGNETNTLFNRNSDEVGYVNKSVKPLPRKGMNDHISILVQANIPDNGTDTLFNRNAGEVNRSIQHGNRSVQPLPRRVGERMQIREPKLVQAIVPSVAINDQINSRDASTRAMPQSDFTTSPGVQSRAASTRRVQDLNETDLEESEEEYECRCMERFRRRRRRLRCYDGYPRFPPMGPSCRFEDPNIVRPCFLDDFKCMADNLAVNSNCKRDVPGRVASLYRIPKFKFDTPFFNATYIDYNLKNRGRDKCFVSEFFFNKKSRNLLITIDCPNLNFESTRTYLEHRSFLEDSVYSYNINATYPLIRLTTVLPRAKDFDLCSVRTFAYVAELPKFYIDPNDPKTANYLTRDLKLLNIYERETFYWRANELARCYINSLICDFGCY